MTCRRLLGISVEREIERLLLLLDNCETNLFDFYSSQIIGVIVQVSCGYDPGLTSKPSFVTLKSHYDLTVIVFFYPYES